MRRIKRRAAPENKYGPNLICCQRLIRSATGRRAAYHVPSTLDASICFCVGSLLQLGVHVSHDLLGGVWSEGLEDRGAGRLSESVHREPRIHRVRCLQLGRRHRSTQHAYCNDDQIIRQDRC